MARQQAERDAASKDLESAGEGAAVEDKGASDEKRRSADEVEERERERSAEKLGDEAVRNSRGPSLAVHCSRRGPLARRRAQRGVYIVARELGYISLPSEAAVLGGRVWG